MKSALLACALFLGVASQSFATEAGRINCRVAKLDYNRKASDDNYYTVLKSYDLKIGEDVQVKIESEGLEVDFSTGYVTGNDGKPAKTKNDVVLQVNFSVGGYEIFGIADTYRSPHSRFAVNMATPSKIAYEVSCSK